eukprot:COSAG04_NODE_1102_length_8251_cov_3.245339_3_plen_52_part_00
MLCMLCMHKYKVLQARARLGARSQSMAVAAVVEQPLVEQVVDGLVAEREAK